MLNKKILKCCILLISLSLHTYIHSHIYIIYMVTNVEVNQNVYKNGKEMLGGKTTIIKLPQAKKHLHIDAKAIFFRATFRVFLWQNKSCFYQQIFKQQGHAYYLLFWYLSLTYINTPETSSLKLIKPGPSIKCNKFSQPWVRLFVRVKNKPIYVVMKGLS